jgi:7,8-dihydropterin-6-yl-methyl-4-(beta-D-ribofuranosyl)aminobenzene 5'-phosphate synthase
MKINIMRQVKFLAILLILCACQPVLTPLTSLETPSKTSLRPTPIVLPSSTPENPTLTPALASPSPTDTPPAKMEETMEVPSLRITILYNNIGYDSSLETAWGFSALVERNGETLLFDTGGDGGILLRNMTALGVDPSGIQSIVLSHIHGDHIGGLNALLNTGIQPTIYVPPSFPTDYKNSLKQFSSIVEVEPGQTIMEGMLSTGEMGTSIPEQALIICTTKGMVIVAGCAHPGIDLLVDRAITLVGDPVYLVMGGFHLGSASNSRITSILEAFRRMGVQKVAPSHCTGETAIDMFRHEYGDDFIESGVGFTIVIEP